MLGCGAGTVFAYGVTSSGKTHTMHVSLSLSSRFYFSNFDFIICSVPVLRVSRYLPPFIVFDVRDVMLRSICTVLFNTVEVYHLCLRIYAEFLYVHLISRLLVVMTG